MAAPTLARVLADLALARADEEALMVDACTITRPGAPVTDAAGVVTPTTGATVYTGKCRVATYEAHETATPSGGRTRVGQRYKLRIPVGAGPVQVGDIATITAAAADPHLVGTVYRIAGGFNKSLASSQRLDVDEVVA